MDGEFLELDAESIDSELDELYRELFKSNKQFNKRLEDAEKKGSASHKYIVDYLVVSRW